MRHLDVDLLQAVLDGDLPPKTLLRRLLDHVGELCPQCAGAVAALRQGSEESAAETGLVTAARRGGNGSAGPEVVTSSNPRLFDALDRVQDGAAEWAQRVRRERRRADADLRDILRTPREERQGRVENARSRFRSRALAELLLEESRRQVQDDPAEARSMAALAEVVLLRIPGAGDQDWAHELSLRAHAWEANAWRVVGDLRTADRLFTELRARLACEMSNSEGLHAEICSLEASLRIDQSRTHEARRLLSQAAHLHGAANDSQALGRVLMKWAIIERQEDDLEAALRIQRRSLELLDAEADPRLYLQALTNLGSYLLGLERNGEASALFSEHQAALQAHGMWNTPALHIVRGRLAIAAGDVSEAERQFLAAREHALQRGETLRVAIASFDLALLYLDQCRTAELRQMACWMGRVFASQEIHDDAMATMVLFRQAAATDALTAEAVRAWRRRFDGSAWNDRRRSASRPS